MTISVIHTAKRRLRAAGLLPALLLAALMLMCRPCNSVAQGRPFFRNYTTKDYGANNRNFDIITGEDGTVYVANFEGLLYYDGAEWRILHTPSITRITALFRDSKGTIWTGGYNYMGRLTADENGRLALQSIGRSVALSGEVDWIWEQDGTINFRMSDGKIYAVSGDDIVQNKDGKVPDSGNTFIVNDNNLRQVQRLEYGMRALATDGSGLIITDSLGRRLSQLTEENGLCSDNINHITYDGHGTVWGATDNGIFSVALPSRYSCVTREEGLLGEVLSIQTVGGRLMVGTLEGLFAASGGSFKHVGDMHHACWQLVPWHGGLLAATATGLYSVDDNGQTRQMSTANTMSMLVMGDDIMTGEIDGVYLRHGDGSAQKVCQLENVTQIMADADGTVWLRNLYGQVWSRKPGSTDFSPHAKGKADEAATIVMLDGRVVTVGIGDDKPFPYPLFSYTDDKRTTWLTDDDGHHLYSYANGRRQQETEKLLHPLAGYVVRAMLRQGGLLWIGGDFGLVCLDVSHKDAAMDSRSRLMIRSVTLAGDSVLWGGYGSKMPNLKLGSRDRNLRVTFAMNYRPLLGSTLYRYRLDDGRWSAWDDDTDAELTGLSYGRHRIDIQSTDAKGKLSETVTAVVDIEYPIYMRWYMLVLYAMLLAMMVQAVMRWRLRRLKAEKVRLESIVQQRTQEVVKQRDEIVAQRDEIVKQKDEIEQKSRSLEQALDDLGKAQHELVRQEKMATVGKLTQGLIDRILNPMNYINNFSKLSEGLLRDLEANIEDEKEHIDAEVYDDTVDILGMLKGNLQKVGEHGLNTTRTLKAMEEMLKDRTGGIVPMNLTQVLHQDEEMLRTYYADEIARHHINIMFDLPTEPMYMQGNAEQLSKTIMSLLGNSVYAVAKKAQRQDYQPQIALRAIATGNAFHLAIRDNGVGIEESILGKVFDPFFTTKTTGEAAGVGLYLSHEIIQNHKGDIHVSSRKNEFTQFDITLPQQP